MKFSFEQIATVSEMLKKKSEELKQISRDTNQLCWRLRLQSRQLRETGGRRLETRPAEERA